MSISPTTTHHALILLERDPITGTKLALKSRRSHVSGGNTELNSTLRNWPLNLKSLVGIVGCTFGLGVVYFGYGVGTESPKKEAAAKPSVPVQRDVKKPVRAMNFALGNMVFFAQDLGFSATSFKDNAVDASKIAARIESQLQGVRELYRAGIIKNPNLAGSMMLQFNIAPSGEVNQVREISSRINDSEFKKAIIAEAANWSFAELVSENLSVTCPLLFVHQGMDITTLVQWELSVGNLGEKAAQDRVASNPMPSPQARAPQSAAAAMVPAKPAAIVPAAASAKPEGKVFQIKYPTSLRKDPNFSSPSLATLTIGTRVAVLQKQGDWLEVRSTDNSPIGFIRKEFVTLVEVARK